MQRKLVHSYAFTYYIWIILFVILPFGLLFYQSFFDIYGNFTLANYKEYFTNISYLKMTLNSFVYAFLVTLITLLFSYPMAYFLSRSKNQNILLLLLLLPTWINLLLKAYAFIGLFSKSGVVNDFLTFLGIGPKRILFTDTAFILVAAYVELPFMVLPIYNSISEIPNSLIEASFDLGAKPIDTLRRVIIPLSMGGVRSGIQAVFIPSLSLFMLVRLIGGNRVITLGTAVEQHFLVTQNWGMGSTIGVVLLVLMAIVMWFTRDKKEAGGR